jgi:predicted dehydrogenase
VTALTVIGAGDVVRKRYAEGMAALGSKPPLHIAAVIDVRPPQDIGWAGQSSRVLQLTDQSPDGLVALLRSNGLAESPAIIATPTAFHVPYALALMGLGMKVAIEKPFALNREQVRQFDEAIGRTGSRDVFLLGYYALEKGLPLFCLGLAGAAPDVYLDQLQPRVQRSRLEKLRRDLGRVRSIRAVLLEGRGDAAQLDHRSWVLDARNGGNTLETFYHLVCMTSAFVNIERARILSTALASHRETAEHYRQQTGLPAAETMTLAALASEEGASVRLACGKYVSERVHERWMEVTFEHGTAVADFERCVVKVRGPNGELQLGLKNEVKYATQFALLQEKLRDGAMRTELQLFRHALLSTLAIREHGARQALATYSTEDITREAIDAAMNAGENVRHIVDSWPRLSASH